MRLVLFLLFLGISKSLAQGKQPLQVYVSLTEQNSPTDNQGSSLLRFFTTLTCLNDDCTFSVQISHYDNQEFKVFCNNEEKNAVFDGSISRKETANITIQKEGYYLDLFALETTDGGKISVLGCESGLYNSAGCIHITNTDTTPSLLFYDVCICTGQSPSCDNTTPNGTCSSGEATWWKEGSGISTSSTFQPAPSTTSQSTTSADFHFSTSSYRDIAVTFSENPSGTRDHLKVKVTGSMNCSTDYCFYSATIANQNKDVFTVLVEDKECPSSCSGAFSSLQSIPVTITRTGQHLNLFEFKFNQDPAILGCADGLTQKDTCLRATKDDDEVCSCMGTATDCDDTSEEGACLGGGDTTWWLDDPTSSSTLATTTFPVQDPNIFDVSFLLSESVEGATDANSYDNVTVTVFMNCTGLTCNYGIQVFENAQMFYTVLVADEPYTGSPYQGRVSKGQTVPVTVKRSGETVDLFDLQFIDSPNIVILGCTTGLLSYGHCQKVDYYDANVQKLDTLCVCQSRDSLCNSQTSNGKCDLGSPIWWKSGEPTTSQPRKTNLEFSIKLIEDGDTSDYSVNADTTLVCDNVQMACTYEVFLAYTDSGKKEFTVLVGGQTCPDDKPCQSSFQKSETVPVVVKRNGQILDWFELTFENVTILGCKSGFLSQDCQKIEYSSPSDLVKDEMCCCPGQQENQCSADTPDAVCTEGTPAWWRKDPDATTTPVPTTTESPIKTKTFTVLLSEKNLVTNSLDYGEVYNLTVSGSMNCTLEWCSYQVDIVNEAPNYYTVVRNGEVCSSPCSGYISKGDVDASFIVHRSQQHLNLVVFSFGLQPEILIAGCTSFEKTSGVEITSESATNDGVCLQVPGTLRDGEVDNLCVCQGQGEACDNHPPVGMCTNGEIIWWVDDPGRTTKSPSTTEDRRNVFEFQISFKETNQSTMNSHEFSAASSLTCTEEECSYSIDVINYDQDYFTVFVGNDACDPLCDGSFMKGKAVNLTVFRGEQKLDLFDFEYTDIPRVVVLGCEEGLVEYGECTTTSQTNSLGNDAVIDEVCSCRSAVLDCSAKPNGYCSQGAVKWWKDVDESSSTSPMPTTTSIPTTTTVPPTPEYIPPLKNLSDSTIGLNNVSQILNDTQNYSNQGANLNGSQIFEISKVLHKSANVPGISADNAMQILANMDACLNAHENEIRRGHSKEYNLLGVLRPMVHNTVDTLIQYLDGKNMGFGAKKVDCSNIDSDDGLIDYGRDVGFAALNDTNRLSATQHNSIIVPLKKVCADNEQITHVFFTIYRGQKLFVGQQRYRSFGAEESDPNKQSDEESVEGFRVKRDANENDTAVPFPPPCKCQEQISVPKDTPVLSATLMNNGAEVSRISSSGPKSPIVAELQFNVGKLMRPLHGSLIVSWFDQGAQLWETREQCKVTSFKDGIVTATCEHLTDFSALVFGQLNAQYVCSGPLVIVGYIVNSISIACLAFLIAIGLMFYIHAVNVSRLLSFIRGQIPTKGDIINLTYYCIFLMFFVLLIGFMDQSKGEEDLGTTSTYCVVIAALSYFSLLSAIMLSMLIGIRMVSHFFPPKLRTFFGVMTSAPAALSIGFVVPFTLTTIIAVFDTSFFKRDDSFCWVRPDFVVYAVIIPITIPIINGLICSTFAIYKMFFQAKRGLSNKETSHHDAEFWSKVFGLVIMQVAMGLPWGIEFIIIGISGSSAWNYIFVILLGTQGIDLFLIFLYRRQRLVNESKKWSAREQRFGRNSKRQERARVETFMD